MLPRNWPCSVLVVAPLLLFAGFRPALADPSPMFSSVHPFILTGASVPHHYRYRSHFVDDSVRDWDGGIRQVMAIDERYGWMQAEQETLRDPHGHDATLSVQLFQSARGARGDFAQFFTNKHPQTIYEPGAYWLGGRTILGYGKPATLYRMENDLDSCPQHLEAGLSFVYGNGIFSVNVCLHTVGERGARSLAQQLWTRARHHQS